MKDFTGILAGHLAEAYGMIMRGDCGQFSPKLLLCLTEARRELEEKAECSRALTM